jgi:uncharacterized protein (DUF1330 family)
MKITTRKPLIGLFLAILAGVVIGAIGEALIAQAKPPVYMIGEVEITNSDGYNNEYLPPAKKSIADHGGVYVAAGKGYPISGDPPKGRLVILRWESMEQLTAWVNSPDYHAAHEIGEKYAKFRMMAVEGVQPK